MTILRLTMWSIIGVSLLEALPAAAQDPSDYESQVKPLLRARCYACHGALKQEGGLRLDTAVLILAGGDSGDVVATANPDSSQLIKRVSAADAAVRMPPVSEGEALSDEQIAWLRKWIEAGAPAPADEQPQADPKMHWAFQPVVRPPLPVDEAGGAWVANPIDAFISQQRRERDLVPQPPADKRLWLRRVSLDLIGLPPSPDDMAAFLSDDSAEAYDRVVTRLLDSPQYGERWGRHWMDIWRYSDWWGLGAEVRNSQKHIWRWRDWIIESLNTDLGYDQMLREMLAADELYPNDFDRLRATGYLSRQYFIFNRTTWLDETIEHTAKGMLGLTFNCAKCHDHKYDPLTQQEYYELRAIFEPYQVRTEMVAGELDVEKAGLTRAFDANLDAETFLHVRGDDRNPDKSRPLSPGVPAFLSSDDLPLAIEPVVLPIEAVHPGLRPFVVEAHFAAAERSIAEARAAVELARQQVTERVAAIDPPGETDASETEASTAAGAAADIAQANLSLQRAEKRLVTAEALKAAVVARAAADQGLLADAAPVAPDLESLRVAATHCERLLAVARADEELSGAELSLLQAAEDKKPDAEKRIAETKAAFERARNAMETPDGSTYTPLPGALRTKENYQDPNLTKPFPHTSSGRRTAFANWLTDPDHPLPARVAVNHIWMRHMGTPLVPSVFDFGLNGKPPTHPELLDWLAAEFVDCNWSMKHIHRLILTSHVYRLSSATRTADTRTLATDPDNRWYWRMNPARMEAQIVRDSLLHLAGELDLTIGGPPVPAVEESNRRSLYFVHSHNEHQKFLSMFDDASVLECYRRAESIVPQQALALENSGFATTIAEKVAGRIIAAAPSATDADFVRAAFLFVLCHEPTEAEQELVVDTLSRLTEAGSVENRPDPEQHARVAVIQALFNHNDFVTIR